VFVSLVRASYIINESNAITEASDILQINIFSIFCVLFKKKVLRIHASFCWDSVKILYPIHWNVFENISSFVERI
jgi:hypothetical protein